MHSTISAMVESYPSSTIILIGTWTRTSFLLAHRITFTVASPTSLRWCYLGARVCQFPFSLDFCVFALWFKRIRTNIFRFSSRRFYLIKLWILAQSSQFWTGIWKIFFGIGWLLLSKNSFGCCDVKQDSNLHFPTFLNRFTHQQDNSTLSLCVSIMLRYELSVLPN